MRQLLSSSAKCEILLLLSVALLLCRCPFNKVEESFNMQAVHDLMHYDWRDYELMKKMFDHMFFPGVVPRTFVGAVLLSLVSFPLQTLLNAPTWLHGQHTSIPGQLLVRAVLGCWLCWCYRSFGRAVSRRFGAAGGVDVGCLTLLLAAVQFHLPFYMSRTLPNTFGLSGCLLAFAAWLDGKSLQCLCWIGSCAMIFRCDLLVLLAPLALQMLLAGEIPFFRSLLVGVLVCALAAAVTVAVDSYFWGGHPAFAESFLEMTGRKGLVWPEMVVFLFNTLHDQSHNWGVQPWHWYFTNAVPRALNAGVALLPVALLGLQQPRCDARVADVLRSGCIYLDSKSGDAGHKLRKQREALYYALPAVLFVALYSRLPHKELRFIFPALPLLTLLEAVGLQRLLAEPAVDDSACGENVDEVDRVTPTADVDVKPAAPGLRRRRVVRDTDADADVDADAVTQADAEDKAQVMSTARTAVPEADAAWTHRCLGAAIRLGLLLLLLGAMFSYNSFLLAAKYNYEGGEAIHWLTHSPKGIPTTLSKNGTISVHIAPGACMSGVSRWWQTALVDARNVTYSKAEELEEDEKAYKDFDWLLADKLDVLKFLHTFEVAHTVQGYDRLKLRASVRDALGRLLENLLPIGTSSSRDDIVAEWSLFPPYPFPFVVETVAKTFILRRKKKWGKPQLLEPLFPKEEKRPFNPHGRLFPKKKKVVPEVEGPEDPVSKAKREAALAKLGDAGVEIERARRLVMDFRDKLEKMKLDDVEAFNENPREWIEGIDYD